MNSQSGQNLSLEELKQRNRTVNAAQSADWEALMNTLWDISSLLEEQNRLLNRLLVYRLIVLGRGIVVIAIGIVAVVGVIGLIGVVGIVVGIGVGRFRCGRIAVGVSAVRRGVGRKIRLRCGSRDGFRRGSVFGSATQGLILVVILHNSSSLSVVIVSS